jgi:cytochrome c oxidase subunit 2
MVFAAALPGQQPAPAKPQADEPQAIAVTAKKYEFAPPEIHVRKGARVRLKVRALDRTHGMEFKLYPDGGEKSGPPGLRFAAAQQNWKLEKDREREIEFVAERAGTYSFKCSVFCGFGHGGMKGKLIVEE